MIRIMSEEFIDSLRPIPHRTLNVSNETVLFHRDAPVRNLYVVETGMVELVRHAENGTALVLQRASDQSVLAEASIYSQRYHCDAVVKEDARLLKFSKRKLLEVMTTDPKFMHLWGSYLSSAVQNARHRAEILSRRSIADRLDGWLAMHDEQMPAKGQWKSIATEIGVTPEALYREIAKRRS
jgi:CRP/FNR family transcriptional regulator, dissimilatory nitrate respiration regulator